MRNKYKKMKHSVVGCVVMRRHLPTAAQLSTITFLQTNLKKPVTLVSSPGRHTHPTPINLHISGQPWSLKNPTGNSPRTLQRAFRDAARRTENIIIDLGNTDLPDEAALIQLKQLFDATDHAKNLLIVTSTAELIEHHK